MRRRARLACTCRVGDEVVLSAGIFGTIRSLSDARAEIEIAPGTVITVARQVVVRRGREAMPPGAPLPLTLPPEARRVD